MKPMISHRDNSFNIIRHLAAFFVLLSHSYSLANNFSSEPWKENFGFSLGSFSVFVFFILSGFLIALSLSRNSDFISYATSRALRILPAFCVVILLTVFLLGPGLTSLSLEDYFSNIDTYKYLSNLSMSGVFSYDRLPGVFINNPFPGAVNGSLWTLPYEIRCYVLVFLCFKCFELLRFPQPINILLFCIIAFVFHLEFYFGAFGRDSSIGMLLYACFFYGVTLSYFYKRLAKNKKVISFLLIFSLLLFFGSPAWFGFLFPIVCGPLLIVFGNSVSCLSRRFNTFDFSYGIYIYAFLVQQTIMHLFQIDSPMILTIYAGIVTILLSSLSWYLIEKPCLDAKKFVLIQLKGLRLF